MSEFEKRMVRLNGGLRVRIDDKEDEARFTDALQKVSKDNGPWASSFFRAWTEAFGAEIKGGDFGLLAEAVFIPLMTVDEAMQKNRAMLKCVFDDEEEIERELRRRMPHYVQTSEGVIWAGNKIDAEQKGGC